VVIVVVIVLVMQKFATMASITIMTAKRTVPIKTVNAIPFVEEGDPGPIVIFSVSGQVGQMMGTC
jgi:hypothetical protein